MGKKIDVRNMSNSELELLRKDKRDEYEKVRLNIVQLFDYWMRIETDYNKIESELKNRNLL
jgi:hypothetical protein